jgi:hypothetical protein
MGTSPDIIQTKYAPRDPEIRIELVIEEVPASSFPGNPPKLVLKMGPINLRVRIADFEGCPCDQ